jgi:uncharacterized protein
MPAAVVILDTNVFVAAGFKHHSTSARILHEVRTGRLRMVWNEATRRETKHVLGKIPPLSWDNVAELFRTEDCYRNPTHPERFHSVADRDDRKYAALAAATGAALVTSDDHLLRGRDQIRVEILTPGEFWKSYQLEMTKLEIPKHEGSTKLE